MTTELNYSSILGTKINVTDMEKTVSYIAQHLKELKGHYICVSNVHTTVTAYRDEEYRDVQNNAAMNIPDGKPLSIVQRRSGFREAGRVPGPDLMPEIFSISEDKGYRHYFYGSRQETLDALREKLMKQYPRLKIVGMYSPPFRPMSEEEDAETVKKINACRPDFIWIGLGAPKQEKWMAAHDGKVCGVMLGVGAGFDFHAGTIRRAPLWMQEFCMEWLFRIGQDPKRLLPRYLDTNFSFVFYLALSDTLLIKLMCILISAVLTLSLAACSNTEPAPVDMEPKTSQMKAICELAVMDCYYHNVAKFTEKDAEQIFHRFYRKDASRNAQGSGLGMSVAKLLAEQMGGRLDAQLEEGMLAIRLLLPCADKSADT